MENRNLTMEFAESQFDAVPDITSNICGTEIKKLSQTRPGWRENEFAKNSA